MGIKLYASSTSHWIIFILGITFDPDFQLGCVAWFHWYYIYPHLLCIQPQKQILFLQFTLMHSWETGWWFKRNTTLQKHSYWWTVWYRLMSYRFFAHRIVIFMTCLSNLVRLELISKLISIVWKHAFNIYLNWDWRVAHKKSSPIDADWHYIGIRITIMVN